MNNKIEKLAIFLIVFWVVSLFANNFFTSLLFPERDMVLVTWHHKVYVGTYAIIEQLIGIAFAVWLYKLAQKEHKSKWTWALLGLIFSISAVILYYLIQLLEELKNKKEDDKEKGLDNQATHSNA